MISLVFVLQAIVCLLVSLIYIFYKYKLSYWQRNGVPQIPPSIPFGNLQGFRPTVNPFLWISRYYRHNKGKFPFTGLYFFFTPVALITDIELVKNVLIKDFQDFQDRGMFYNEKDDPLTGHLFNFDGNKWKALRHKLTPTFTSGKMKFMFPTIVDVGEKFQKTLRKLILKDRVDHRNELDIKELLARFTTDVIGSCAFGIECNSLEDPNCEFRKMGKKVFEAPRNGSVKQLFIITCRDWARKLHFKTNHDDVTEFFLKVVRENIQYREANNIRRNDFMDMLIDFKNGKNQDGIPLTGEMSTMSLEEITAQSFVFFLAGFETSSTAMTFCLYELALHQDIQDKAREEISNVLKKHNGQYTYEAMKEMTYVSKVINESLRKYPPGTNIIRKTVKDYRVPNTEIILRKGTIAWIPIYGIHHDPEFYPNPDKFDPERFSSEATQNRQSCTYLPFGEGPRNCIGLRFGLMQTHVGLVTLLNNFRFEATEQTPIPLKFKVKSLVLCPDTELHLKINTL